MTIDVFVVVDGYLSYFQAKRQLDSPLIPKYTAYQIFSNGRNIIMMASIITAIIFLLGLWLYTFNKKILAFSLFVVAPICFKLLLL